MSVHTLRWRGGWARIGPWRSHTDVAQLTVGADSPPTPDVIHRCLEFLRARRYQAVLTSALTPADSLPFVDAGFTVRERLHLLTHELAELPRPAGLSRRATRRDRRSVLTLDSLAFDGFWRLDRGGLLEAVRATPSSRFRVIDIGDERHVLGGYAITGRAGVHGYLQRIAVHPAMRSHGLGRELVGDALAWLVRNGAHRALVNTQLDNGAALALYEACGFHRLPVGLTVLGRTL